MKTIGDIIKPAQGQDASAWFDDRSEERKQEILQDLYDNGIARNVVEKVESLGVAVDRYRKKGEKVFSKRRDEVLPTEDKKRTYKVMNERRDIVSEISIKREGGKYYLLEGNAKTEVEIEGDLIVEKESFAKELNKLYEEYQLASIEKMTSDQLSAQDFFGNTALHLALIQGSEKIALKLIDKITPKQLEIGNREEKTALDLALIRGSKKIIKALIEKMGIKPVMEQLGYIPDPERIVSRSRTGR